MHLRSLHSAMADIGRLAEESGNAVAMQRAEEAEDNYRELVKNLEDVRQHVLGI